MRIQVFDIGNSNLKHFLYKVDDNNVELEHSETVPTERNFKTNLAFIRKHYNNEKKDAVIVLSMSDNVVWQSVNGHLRWIPAGEPCHPYAREEEYPAYRESGKPRRTGLDCVFDQMKMIWTHAIADRTAGRNRVLPVSTMIACQLAGDNYFNSWDMTHASNSGVFSYQIPSNDERFPKSGWHPCVDPMIEAGYFSREIVKSSHILTGKDGTPILIGGHDTTFVNALDEIYSTKPYISVGTWITVSVESSVRPNWEDEGARYIIAPNGAILKQLCFPALTDVDAIETAAHSVMQFLNTHLPGCPDVPIKVFGGWKQRFWGYLRSVGDFHAANNLHLVDSVNLESETAARYAKKVLEES